MGSAQLCALQAGGDHGVERHAVDHGLGDGRADGRRAGHSWLRKMSRHTDGDRVGHRARDIAGVKQANGRDAHGRAIGIAPEPGLSRVFAGFQRVDAAARAGADIGRVVAVDAVVPGDDAVDRRFERDRAGVDDCPGDGEGLLTVIGYAPGGQAGVHDMVVGRGLPAIQPAESALGVVGVDLGRHGEGIAERLAVEAAEYFV